MANRIRVLPEAVANKIAAGEVVERPASVVKELLENSLDAGAGQIIVEVRRGGKSLIKVSDDGEGMSETDALLALERHATSKILSDSDLFKISTLGFRGEAIPSIASVSRLRIITRTANFLAGTEVEVEGGKINAVRQIGCPPGTTVEVRSLFFNVPVRLKFLKGVDTEFAHIAEAVSKLALSHVQVQFKLIHNGQIILDLPRTEQPEERLVDLIGKDARGQIVPFSLKRDNLRVWGYTCQPGISRSNSRGIYLFVNRRYVRDRLLVHGVCEAYRNLLPKDRFPITVALIEIELDAVDVNIHPTKSEVRFSNPHLVYQALSSAVRSALSTQGQEEKSAVAIRAWETRKTNLEAQRQWALEGPRPEVGFEERAPSLMPRGFFASLEVIGQARSSFILCQSAHQLVFIDQHAAHERIIFEKLKRGYDARNVPSQALLLPAVLELTLKEAAIMARHRQELSSLGFEIEPFGGRSFLVKTIPEILGQVDCRPLILDLLEELSSLGETEKMEKIIDKVLMLIACHQVIKANVPLERKAIRYLLEELDHIDFSLSCPHGRPVWKEIPFQEIEKMFKR